MKHTPERNESLRNIQEPPTATGHILRTPYDKHRRYTIVFPPESSMTKQAFKDECDINNIVRNFVKTGVLEPHLLQKREAMYADVSNVGDLMQALEIVENAYQGFATLPSEVREKFKNDPAVLLAFLENPSNHQEAIDLGILEGVKTPKSGTSATTAGEENPPAPPTPTP